MLSVRKQFMHQFKGGYVIRLLDDAGEPTGPGSLLCDSNIIDAQKDNRDIGEDALAVIHP